MEQTQHERITNRTMRSVANRAICVEGLQMPLTAATRTAESGLPAFYGSFEDDDGT